MTKHAVLAGVSIVTLVRPYGADADTVYLQHVLTGEPVIIDDVAALVLAQGHEPVTTVADVAGLVRRLHRGGAPGRGLSGAAHRRGSGPRGPAGRHPPLTHLLTVGR